VQILIAASSFGSADAREALGVSADAAKLAPKGLIREKAIASSARGLYVIVSREYRPPGCLPADQFITLLMERSGLFYYAVMLSATQHHCAAHHRPQEFRVMLVRRRAPVKKCGKVRVTFFVRKRLTDVPVQSFNTPRGMIRVSMLGATALDLIGYQNHIGGLDRVATLLSELTEHIDAQKLTTAANMAPLRRLFSRPSWSRNSRPRGKGLGGPS